MKPIALKNLLNIALVANLLEWYEFSIYGLLASTMGLLFFPTHHPTNSAILAFTVFAMSYLARPLGSFYFGYIGDRIGRSFALKLSLLLMAIPTAAIGLLPNFAQVGWLATGLLILLRLIQGFAVGGEMPSSACYVFEASEARLRLILTSIVWASAHLGFLLATFVAFLLFRYLDQTTILIWGWRIPFLLGVPITCFIAYVRTTIREDSNNVTHTPFSLTALFPQDKKALLKGMVLAAFTTSCVYVFSIWMPFYLEHFLGVNPATAYLTNAIAKCALFVIPILSGYLAHYFGYHRIIKVFYIAILVSIYPLFNGLQTGSYTALWAIQFVLDFLLGSIGGVMIETVGQFFQKAERARGMSLSFTLPTAFIGGLTPLVCTWLTHKSGPLFPVFYILFWGLLAAPIVLRLKRRA